MAIALINILYTPDPELVEKLIEDGFNDPVPTTDERGQCLIYQTTTLNTTVVDTLTPVSTFNDLPNESRCSDGFLYALQKQYRTCQAPQCRGKDNTIYSKGETEYFYTKCANLEKCQNSKKILVYPLIITDGKLDLALSRCLSYKNETFRWELCAKIPDLNNGQLFNIEDNGIQTRIRVNQKCLFPTDSTYTISRDCNDELTEGYNWKWMPSNTTIDNITFSPAQMAVYDKNLDYNKPTWVKSGRSLQGNVEPYVLKSPLCDNTSRCQTQTGIISIYSWNNLIGNYDINYLS